jgi:hypothetical protein
LNFEDSDIVSWPILVAYFFGGAFYTNAIPHVVCGLTGRSFPSAFSRPVGVGLSSPLVNFLWGLTNFVIGSVLVFRVGEFSVRSSAHLLVAFCGSLVIGVMLARHFGKIYSGSSPRALRS